MPAFGDQVPAGRPSGLNGRNQRSSSLPGFGGRTKGAGAVSRSRDSRDATTMAMMGDCPGEQSPGLRLGNYPQRCPPAPNLRGLSGDGIQGILDRSMSRPKSGIDGFKGGSDFRNLTRTGSKAVAHTVLAADGNLQFRQYMEDDAMVIDPAPIGRDGETWGLYIVYDGHGGRAAVDYCMDKAHDVLLSEMRDARLDPSGIAHAMDRAFGKVDVELRSAGTWRCGCTATVVLAQRSPGGLRLHFANVGDSRAIVIDGSGGVWRATVDHRPLCFQEARRVEADGGIVRCGRVAGVLAISRALGDHALKDQGVSWHPHVAWRDASTDKAVIIASDGLWDALSDEDARDIFLGVLASDSDSRRAADRTAQALISEAKRRGSMDNITALCLFL